MVPGLANVKAFGNLRSVVFRYLLGIAVFAGLGGRQAYLQYGELPMSLLAIRRITASVPMAAPPMAVCATITDRPPLCLISGLRKGQGYGAGRGQHELVDQAVPQVPMLRPQDRDIQQSRAQGLV